MSKFSVFQKNNLIIGTILAAELPSSSPELKSFVVIGSYVKNSTGGSKPSKILNREHDDLRFWIRKYEINKSYMGIDDEISERQLASHFFITNIEKMEQLESEVETYLNDFSLFKTLWNFRPRIPLY